MTSNFKFFKTDDSFDYSFVKTPKSLFYDEECIKLSPHARLLYIAMLERQSLSVQNNWKDKDGNVYIIFSQDDAKRILSCSQSKIIKTFAELDSKNGVGLIKRKRRGLCKPDIIYINAMLFSCGINVDTYVDKDGENVEYKENNKYNIQNKKFLNSIKESSGTIKIKHQELFKTEPNNININNIKNNYI